MRLGPQFGRAREPEYWENIQAGVRLGIEEAARQGVRLCCLDLSILATKADDFATSPSVVESRLAEFVSSKLTRSCELVSPLRTDWLTTDVIALAKGIHADAAIDRYPILSDALRDAGCEDPLIHDHLQMCPDHGPSCWVVEMILAQTRTAGA